MNDAALSPPPPPPPAPMWFALFAGPAVWALQGAIVWFLESRFCAGAHAGEGMPVPAGARAWVVTVSIVAAVIALVALLIAAARWRESRDPGLTAILARTRPDFLAAFAVLVDFSFLVAIALTAFASAMLPVCDFMR